MISMIARAHAARRERVGDGAPQVAATHPAEAGDVGTGRTMSRAQPKVCVLVPTRNEAENVALLLARLGPVLARLDGEVLFVDDSDDQTPAVVAAEASAAPVPVRLLHRSGAERVGGLGGAVQAGLKVVAARWTVVMDGDLQHPPEQLPELLAIAERGVDLVVATRYAGDGSADGLSSRFRGVASVGAGGIARALFPRALASVSDPMSGFFAIRTAAVRPDDLQLRGFKILLEMLVRMPGLRVAEVPFTFAERQAGESKASWQEAVCYLRQLVGLRAATAAAIGRRNQGRDSESSQAPSAPASPLETSFTNAGVRQEGGQTDVPDVWKAAAAAQGGVESAAAGFL